ncbi:MAG: type II toxin-antitoxin system MqsA family antitoxin [Anaerolineae bacterium]|nr:type II toxin-antitoxin system MqsA family antitoxin [Anaerolineae bacterium]
MTGKHSVTYTDDTTEPVVIIQGVPAQVCQQCGERFYDSDVAERLSRQVDEIRAGRMTRVVALVAAMDS